MKPSQNCVELIKKFEGFRSKAYLDPIAIPTIGYGTIRYSTGVKVKMGDVITAENAEFELLQYLKGISAPLGDLPVNQNQIDAITSFVYNLGMGNFNKSTLKKKIVANHNDESIRAEFQKWVRAGGQVLNGLKKRRAAESELYFS